MFIKLALCTLFVAASVASAAAQPASADGTRTSDHEQIIAVVRSVAEAWNAHDMQRFSELFTPDADWVNIRGNRWKGSEAIRNNHVAIHKRFYSKSRVEFTDITVRTITPDVAVVHAKESVTGSDVPKEAGISPDSQMSLVIVRRGGKWLIANGQNTNIAPAPGAREE